MSKQKIVIETKVQTVYYQTEGKVEKHFLLGDKPTIIEAEKILKDKGFTNVDVIAVNTEKAYIELDSETFENSITKTETYYKKRGQ